ncbi:MAG: prepilin-type N-terminal cleavage/methylation domain-containing protein [Gemmatimonadaceae bacterium]
MNRKGFTLIELLIVVVIIGILAAIAIPKFANTKNKAYVTAMKSDLRNLLSTQESYFADNMKYGTAAQLGVAPSTGVSMPAIITGKGSWTATNSHSQYANAMCGIMVGTSVFPTNVSPAAGNPGEGEPACELP